MNAAPLDIADVKLAVLKVAFGIQSLDDTELFRTLEEFWLTAYARGRGVTAAPDAGPPGMRTYTTTRTASAGFGRMQMNLQGTVMLAVDMEKLADCLGRDAIRNKTRRATHLNGSIVAIARDVTEAKP